MSPYSESRIASLYKPPQQICPYGQKCVNSAQLLCLCRKHSNTLVGNGTRGGGLSIYGDSLVPGGRILPLAFGVIKSP